MKNREIVPDNMGIKPKLEKGMKPVKWDGTKWVEANPQIKGDWFDYSEGVNKWANVETENGYFVYIPRYSYKITSMYHQNGTSTTSGEILIDFIDTENKSLKNSTVYSTIEPTATVGGAMSDYVVHPAFVNNVENGGWDKELEGIWVAKYEMSLFDKTTNAYVQTTTTELGNLVIDNSNNINTDKIMKSWPNVSSWSNVDVTNIFTSCKEMNKTFGSHMMKNSEWGAVAYLAQSKYGKNQIEVAPNDSKWHITGTGGVDASTTGNEYGIYDMNSSAWEYVSAYMNSTNILAGGTNYSYNKSMVDEKELKYKQIYAENEYTATNHKFGDALYETSNNYRGWYEDWVYFDQSRGQSAVRGGLSDKVEVSGLFYIYDWDGKATTLASFRVVLAF